MVISDILTDIPHINFTKENIGHHIDLKSILNHVSFNPASLFSASSTSGRPGSASFQRANI
jgi:hypothetical protein